MPLQKVTKEEIITVCTKVFWTKGYYNSTIEDLSKASGLSKSLFYHHFQNKENLMIESIKQSHNYFKKNVFSVFYNEQTEKEKIEELVLVCEKVFCHNMKGCFMGNIILETSNSAPQFKPYIKAFFEDWVIGFEQLFKTETDLVKKKNLAEQCIIEIEGALIMMRLKDDKKYLIKALQNIKNRI
jgi:AcrR family transcriptional regulator